MAATSDLKFDVVIAGGGFAGVYCARALAKEFGDETHRHVALISDQNFTTFQPMLPEVVGSTLSPRHVVNPIRRLCRDVTVLRGDLSNIDLAKSKVLVNAGDFTESFNVEFRHLVLAMGGIVDVSRVPGMVEHAYLMKNVGDALRLRGAIIDRFEEANYQTSPDVQRRLLTFVIVGGGYSGVETAGQILDLAKEMLSYYPRISEEALRVVLVHSGPYLLPEISTSLGRYAEENLKHRGVELVLNSRVVAVTSCRALLQDKTEIETHTVVCTVGNAPNPLITELCKTNNIESEKGRVITEPTLQVRGHQYLWAAGDCAAVPMAAPGSREDSHSVAAKLDAKYSPFETKKFCPPTAQFAVREGTLMGQNIARHLRNPTARLKTFQFTGLGELAAIGHHAAVAEIMGMKFSGFFAWWLWRTIYLMKLPGLERKLRVMIDWTLDLFFPRDIALFQSEPTHLLKEMHLEKGDRLFRAGEPARSLYVVKSGRLELLDGGGKVLRTLSAGDQIGKNTILAGTPWPFDALVAEPATLVAVSARVFEAVASTGASLDEVFSRPSPNPPAPHDSAVVAP